MDLVAGTGWPRVSVVIPTLNEAANIVHVLPRLPAGVHEILLVDGGSTDGTVAVARSIRPDLQVVNQSRRGKGHALAVGVRQATGDIVVLIDGDGSTDPGEIPRFVAALLAGADFAKGSRLLPGGGSEDLTVLRRAGNRALCSAVNRIYARAFTDLCYGFNAFWRFLAPVLGMDELAADSAFPVHGDGFEIETLLHLRAVRAGLRVTEVPSIELRRRYGRSNLRPVRDGMRVLRVIVRERPTTPAAAARAQATNPTAGTLSFARREIRLVPPAAEMSRATDTG